MGDNVVVRWQRQVTRALQDKVLFGQADHPLQVHGQTDLSELPGFGAAAPDAVSGDQGDAADIDPAKDKVVIGGRPGDFATSIRSAPVAPSIRQD